MFSNSPQLLAYIFLKSSYMSLNLQSFIHTVAHSVHTYLRPKVAGLLRGHKLIRNKQSRPKNLDFDDINELEAALPCML